MKRKALLLSVLLGLVISLSMYGCKKGDNPLATNPDDSNTAGARNLATVESVTPANGDSLGNLYGRVEIVFSHFMEENTVSTSNITILNTATNTEVTNHSVAYDPLHRLAFVTVPEWSDNAAFLLRVTTGATNNAGKPMDGDADNMEDGTPYDDFLTTFYTGTGWPALARISPPRISSHTPDTTGGVLRNTLFTVSFANGPMDSLTLTTANFHLTKTATGAAVSIQRLGFTPNSVTFELPAGDLLDWGTRYTFTVDGGEVKAFPDTTGEDTYLLLLDSDGDGPEEAEPDFSWDFITVDTTGSSQGSPPRVVGVNEQPDHLAISFGGDPDEKMEITTFTQQNIRAFDNNGYIPGTFHNDLDSLGLRYFYDRPTSGFGTVSLLVSMQVTDIDGNLLDGNGNGVGGEPGLDDYKWNW